VRYTVPFLTQVWLFSTPIAYPSSLMHEPWRTVYGLNPMVGVVEGFRWAVLGSGNPPDAMFFVSCFAALAILVAGAFYFRRMERGFADIV
jgi:lipopolysaccharide transport system permease protein